MASDRLRDFLKDDLSCLLRFDKATERWLGHCLDLDLVTSAKTEAAAWDNLRKTIKAHVELCWKRDREALRRNRAPQADWDLFKHLQGKGEGRRDKIVFDLLEPELVGGPIWVEALESPMGIDCGKAATGFQAVH
jgi:hypothetical protein